LLHVLGGPARRPLQLDFEVEIFATKTARIGISWQIPSNV
jgi:hypothetical protein